MQPVTAVQGARTIACKILPLLGTLPSILSPVLATPTISSLGAGGWGGVGVKTQPCSPSQPRKELQELIWPLECWAGKGPIPGRADAEWSQGQPTWGVEEAWLWGKEFRHSSWPAPGCSEGGTGLQSGAQSPWTSQVSFASRETSIRGCLLRIKGTYT